MTKNKEEFKHIAIMAHDIKAPLSAIQNLLSIIERGYVDDPNKMKELISRARYKSETIIRMVDDIMDYTLLENKSEIECQKQDISAIINESISTMKSYANDKNISFIYEQPSCAQKYVNGNYTFLLRVFNNVFMNAIKYNKENGKIIINCVSYQKKNILINIEDTGIGISNENLKSIFKLFRRGKEIKEKVDKGVGLGLPIVRQIIKSHKGSVQMTSTVGVGTTVSIKLPLII